MGKIFNSGQSWGLKRMFAAGEIEYFLLMQIKLLFIVFLMSVFFSEPEVKAQSAGGGWLIDTTIIPVTAGLWWGFTNNDVYPGAIDSMRAVIDGVGLDLGLVDGVPGGPGADAQMGYLTGRWFHVIPIEVYKSSAFYNWVEYYSDARYTEWQVEGIEGDTAYLQHDSNIMEELTDGNTTYIKLKPEQALGERKLLWGPYYSQYVYELTQGDTLNTTQYTAVFRMKLENNIPQYEDTTYSDDPLTPICKIEVTQSRAATPWHIVSTYTIDSLILTLGQLKPYFYNYSIVDYNLLSDSCQSDAPEEPHFSVHAGDMATNSGGYDALKQRSYIQFKVIWLGDPNYLLSIDKVTVSDQKGRDIMDPNSQASTHIHNQLDQLSAYNNSILGWIGRDEPNSIDQYAPIKKVNEILNSDPAASSRLWFPLMGKWGGSFGDPGNTIGVYRLSPFNYNQGFNRTMKLSLNNM